MTESSTKIRPMMRPFVFRPVVRAAIPAGFVAAASFFFWAPLYGAIGEYAWLIPALCGASLLLYLLQRIVRFHKTEYEVSPERIVVRTGTIFGDRTIELELVNVTLVEWKSPYLLRLFYGVGHVTAQEAGSATQNARLGYIEEPGEVYERIAAYMREQGFSMQRRTLVREEEPGPIGAFVDIFGRATAAIYATVFLVGTNRELWPLIISDSKPSLWQLLRGNYEVFADLLPAADILARMRVGVIALGGLAVVGVSTWLVLSFVDLLRRTYTMHDDVIDYYDGFLSETRRFIPLENLSDTKLTRPLHKRLLGLSDLRVSSRGAGSEIVFQSMPRAKAFASALEALLEETHAPIEVVSSGGVSSPLGAQRAEQSPTSGETRGDGTGERPAQKRIEARTLKPNLIRAGVDGLEKLLLSLPLILGAPVGLVLSGSTFEIGPYAIASIGALAVAAAIGVGGLAAIGIAKRVVRAVATEYRVDNRRVSETFDFISSRQTKFSVDKITSMSVLRNPIDYLLGTMTVRLRSIGSEESIDFANVNRDPDLLAALERTLDLEAPTDERAVEELQTRFSPIEGLKAKAPLFAILPILWGLGILVSVLLGGGTKFVAAGVGVTLVAAVAYLLWRGIYHDRLRARLFETHLEVSGGIFRKFRHLSAYRHIKAVDSVRYPASAQGGLVLATGGGFSMRVGHLPDIVSLHDHVDERLAENPPTATRAHSTKPNDAPMSRAFEPSPLTEVTRHVLWCLMFVVGVVILPVSGPWVYLWYRRANYQIDGSRIVADIGLVYRWRTTILFDRIDHLETSRKPANKLFKNSDVEVYTVGSTSTDLVLRSLDCADDVLDQIRGRLA